MIFIDLSCKLSFVNQSVIGEKKNIIMLGNPGRGKTHMAIGLALKACSMGMNVLFKNAASLSTELSEARDNYVLGKLEKRIQRADLLVLDEMGYVSFDGLEVFQMGIFYYDRGEYFGHHAIYNMVIQLRRDKEG